jgi:hypothetical protein
MSQSLVKNGCSVPDIPYPPLPHPKAMQAALTPEGVNRGEAEESFPEPSTGAPCPSFLTTPRALGLVHKGCLLRGKAETVHSAVILQALGRLHIGGDAYFV